MADPRKEDPGATPSTVRPVASYLDPKLRRVAELLDVGVVLLAADRSVDYVSPRAEEIVGIPVEEAHEWESVMGDLRTAVDDCWERRISGATEERELVVDEAARTVSFQIFFLDEEECLGFLLLVRDTRLQRALEADLALAIQLRSLHRLYAGLAHDLRSPLNNIVLTAELLRDRLPDDVAPSLLDGLGVIGEEVDRLSSSLDLLISQAVAPSDEEGRFELNTLVTDIGRLLAAQSEFQAVKLDVTTVSEPLHVEGSRAKIRQALINLGVNGLEATPEGGHLQVAVTREGERARVRIVDDGPGIPAALSERIFELHFTTKTSGTGVGLYIARSAIEACGGQLVLEGSGGPGCAFSAYLPLLYDGERS